MAVMDEGIDRIKQMIISEQFAPGSPLPPEQELSADLGLSRISLREVVKPLEVVRVLDVRRGDGTYVRASSRGCCCRRRSSSRSSRRRRRCS
ncbi:UNVERIFIED_CONTAM: GntR family transcriptional regulator [Microbacterium sp. SLM126]